MENITIRRTDKFIEITTNDGYVMTDWNGENILEYSSAKQLVCPVNYDYSAYYTVTDEENERLLKEQIIEIEKRELR